MRSSPVSPVNLSADFRPDEMFFSTTDSKGIIRSGNEVFARVSGYPLGQLIGQPHNIIRHPDMPRVVFRLLWRTVQRGEPIVALVKNMARDGLYYWVVALVVPVADGYLSVRFKPSTETSATLQVLYARLRAEEAAHGPGAVAGKAGMDAAEKLLGEELGKLGFENYERFMWAYLQQEIKSRDLLTGGMAVRRTLESGNSKSPTGEVLASIYESATTAYGEIDGLYRRLDDLTALHHRMAGKSAGVFSLAHTIRFVALSTTIKAAKLRDDGRSLGIIAQYLSEASLRTSGDVSRLTGVTTGISGELHAVIFNLVSARLQLEMTLFFGRELMEREAGSARAQSEEIETGETRAQMIAGLQHAFVDTMKRAVSFLEALERHLAGLNRAANELRRSILMLHVAQVGGKVEATRLRGDDSILPLLMEIQQHIENTDRELAELGDINRRFAMLIQAVPGISRAIDRALGRMNRDVQCLAGVARKTAVATAAA